MANLTKISTVNKTELDNAIGGYKQAIADRVAHDKAIHDLLERCGELDSEIFDIEAIVSNKPDLSGLSIAAIKEYADNQSRLKNQIVALVEVRSTIEKQIKELRSNERGHDFMTTDSKKGIWRVIYDGLLQSFNSDLLEQLIVAGIMIGKPEHSVFSEIALPDSSKRIERIEAMIKTFGIPN